MKKENSKTPELSPRLAEEIKETTNLFLQLAETRKRMAADATEPDCAYSEDACCPKCGRDDAPPDLKSYKVKCVGYPQYIGGGINRGPEGDNPNWYEVHCCRKCKIEYWFHNEQY